MAKPNTQNNTLAYPASARGADAVRYCEPCARHAMRAQATSPAGPSTSAGS